MKYIESFNYRECVFKIYEDGRIYVAKCEEMSTHDDDLKSLKNDKIPTCYRENRIFKL